VKLVRELAGVAAVAALAALVYTCGDAPAPEAPDAPDARARLPLVPLGSDPPSARRDMLEELRRARDAPRHASDGGGSARLQAPAPAEAGRRGSWTIVYRAGPQGVAVGGFVRLTVPAFWDWSPAQTVAPEEPGYTTATTAAAGVAVEARDVPGFWVDFLVRGRALAADEELEIAYGAGAAGAQADRFAERDSRFWISVDGDGDGFGSVLADSPGLDVAPGPADILSLVLPSTAEPEEPILLRIAFLDGHGSRGCRHEGEVALVSAPEGLELPASVTFTAADAGVKAIELRARAKGVYRIAAHAADAGGAFGAESNPLVVEKGVARIRWGDLHGHSNVSDGTGTPEDYLAYARDVAGLDVIALTDHDHWGMLPLDASPEQWRAIREVTERFHEPGRFVTVLGYEWTNWIHGHRHVLYFGGEGQVLSAVDERYETPTQLWDALRGTPTLTFAHHSAGGPIATNWDFAPPSELEPVTEVASVHGASEAEDAPRRIYSPLSGNYVRDALKRGYRLGFVGSGDSHDGHPGLAHLVNPSMGGVAALLTDDLTRAGVRTALLERRCYATNGPRIVLRAALDGQRMGSRVAPRAGPALCYVRAIACAPIAAIELVRSGTVVETLTGEGHWDVEAAFHPADLAAGEYLYVRVVQEDGGAAWSSPFFVE